MPLFRKKAKSISRVGLSVSSDHLVLAHMEERGERPFLMHCPRIALESEKDAAQALAKVVKDLELQDTQCSYVLNRKDYNLHLVEAPEVEEAELRAAVRWKIKDLLDMKVEDAAIDVFPVPDDAYRGRKMVYVVAALKSRIQSIVDMVTESGLTLAVIDIPELAMQNLTRRFVDDAHGVAFMDLRKNGSTMNISREGQMYLTRRINTQMEPDAMQSMEWAGLRDRLVLEIQRSLDYFESQMSQGQVSQIVLAQRQKDSAAMVAALDESLSAKVSVLDLAQSIGSDIELTPELQQIAMAAIGATLRGEKKKVAHVPDPEPEGKPIELTAKGRAA
ncbi:MAG: hypothetical protein HOF74_00650 [Gammaproteobacteria bacterium]|jgi:MSHA biogenesis protein MshI|nr:hypothetical protein [Gammaproteobacteria bacterium]MBT3858314.1 hypothetical protein [Gammaproteobacteria bacterium]MBT3988563.1 hypothetical protein [Gammaproteobacteria bacterium]MBT4257268.1 hypothetical protein [Gammaproteobacteria bacterium]MBT4580499.1 hypothetical protein [Gammaproteobacteria bacterium]